MKRDTSTQHLYTTLVHKHDSVMILPQN